MHMKTSLPLGYLKRWGIRGGFGILDQVVYSGANFIVSILLARWLSAKEFGEFAIGFAILTLFMQIYTSFVLEPIGILGPSNYADNLISYLSSQVVLLFLITTPVAVLLGFIVVVDQYVKSHLISLSILLISVLGLPFMLFPLLMRRVFYVLLKPGYAFAGSVFYILVMIGCLLWALKFNRLNGVIGILIVLFVSLVSGLLMFSFLRKRGVPLKCFTLLPILRETWNFGRWLVLSGFLIGLATQSQVYLAGVLSNVEDAGYVRVLQTFIQPMMLISTAFSALATPVLTVDFVTGDYTSMQRKIYLYTFILGSVSILYEVLLVFFGKTLSNILFGAKYAVYTNQIAVWGLVPIILSLFWGMAIVLQSSQKPYAMVIISGVWGGISFVSALFLIPSLGVWGATISIVSGVLAALLCTWSLYWFWVYRKLIFWGR